MKWILMKIICWLRKLKISVRLVGSFFLISIFPLLVLNAYLFPSYARSVTYKLGQSNLATLQQISKTTDATLENYQYLCGKLSIDPMVQEYLSLYKTVADSDHTAVTLHMDNLINTGIVYPPFMKTIKILDNTGNFLYDMGYDNVSAGAYEAMLRAIDENAPTDRWFYADTFMKQNIIVLGRRINSTNDMNVPLGYTLLFLSEQIFTKEILSPDALIESTTLTILDAQGDVLTSSSNEIEHKAPLYNGEILREIMRQENQNTWDNHFIYEAPDETFLVTYFKNKTLGSYIISCMPFSYVQGESSEMLSMLLIFIFLIAGMCVVLGVLLYYTIMIPLRRAVKICNSIEKENSSVRIPIDSDDEMAFLSMRINRMLDKNQTLLRIGVEEAERKRMLELQMLQYQINPHFLFNTLGTLKWIAELNQVPILVEMIVSLSEILKSSLMDDKEYIGLSKEIRVLDSYVQIQKVRYVNKFEVMYQIDPTLTDCKIPRFILQPLIENAIYHGTYDNGKMILITVSATQQENKLVLKVEDDGRGFEGVPTSQSGRGASIGLQNVRERILKSYRGNASFSITSVLNEGTQCIISVPIVDTEPQKETEDSCTIF